MKKRTILLKAIWLTLALGASTPQFAQESASAPEAVQARRASLIGLMRTINTAEVTENSEFGSFASWQTLLMHHREYFTGWLARFYPEAAQTGFTEEPKIAPGMDLRLNVHADRQGYDVRLRDTTEKQADFGAFSDESGVIWQGGPLR